LVSHNRQARTPSRPELARIPSSGHQPRRRGTLGPDRIAAIRLLQLRKGLLTKDLTPNLKKMEKLAKKLRQEVSP
jgi:hypothetical protein